MTVEFPSSDRFDSEEALLQDVVNWLQPGHRLLFITGAGLSADSGIPTYRGSGGLYNAVPTEDEMPIEQALSSRVFRSHPEITWKYLFQIAEAAQEATFNRGHQVIAEMEHIFQHVCVLTQNVDGFHRDAGSVNLIEIHGNLRELECTACDFERRLNRGDEIPVPPRCPECRAVLRPNIVLFEEMLPVDMLTRFQENWEAGFDAVFSVGTSSVFHYIAAPFVWAGQHGKAAIEINPDDTEVTAYSTHKIRLPAAAALDTIWTRFQQRHGLV